VKRTTKLCAQLAWLLPVVAAVLLGEAPRGFAGVVHAWKDPVDGDFYDATKWTDGTPPHGDDAALFNVAGTYTVTLASSTGSWGLDVTQGNVTFQDGAYYDYAGTITGASLTLGTSGKPVVFTSGPLSVDNGSLNILFGSTVYLTGYTDTLGNTLLGQLFLNSGSVLVDGSSIKSINNSNRSCISPPNTVGGAMVFQNSASGEFFGPVEIGGSLTVKNSSSVSYGEYDYYHQDYPGDEGHWHWQFPLATVQGTLTVESGSTFNASSLSVQGGTVTIDGADSVIGLNSIYYSSTDIPLEVFSGGTVNITNGARLSLPGPFPDYAPSLVVRSGGSIHVGDNGSIACPGLLMLDGGVFSRSATGEFVDPSPSMIYILNGGLATFSGDFQAFKTNVSIYGANSTMQTTDGGSLYCGRLSVTYGGVLSSAADLYIGADTSPQGNVSIDGGHLSVGNDLVVGADGGSGDLQLRNGATVTVGGDLQIASAATPGSGSVLIENSSFPANNIRIGAGGIAGQSGSISLNSSTLTQTAGSQLVVGAAANSTGTLDVENSSFTAGASTALNATGVIVIRGSSADLKALSFNGGRIDFYSGSLKFSSDLDIGTHQLRTPAMGADFPPPGFPPQSNPLTLQAFHKLVTGTTTIGSTATLVMEGGWLEMGGAMVVHGGVYFNQGMIVVNGSGGLTIGDGSPVGCLVISLNP
jgi:T5SS/PEP-CTERM-associated repeat protein